MQNNGRKQYRYGGVITYASGESSWLENLYKSESGARNAIIRERARLKSKGKNVVDIRVTCLEISITGYSNPIGKGLYPSDYGAKDKPLSEYF